MSLLSVKHLKKYYSTQKAVDDISFDIPKGSIFGMLGPNGAGKSTMLRMITGIFYPDDGQILMNGEPLDIHRHTSLIGYMPEERGLYKKMKIGEHAVYLAQLKGLSKKEAIAKTKEWFVRLGMTSWWDKKVEDLSKGMSQKLQFVTTVAHDPILLILDEPFSGLDPVNANVLKDEIFRLAQEGTTIIFSTHRMEQVEEICNQIVLINEGKKILDGNVDQIKQDFKENIFRVHFNNSTNIELKGVDILEQNHQHLLFHLQDGYSTNDILSQLISGGCSINGFQEVLPTLNDIFIKLVEGTKEARVFLN